MIKVVLLSSVLLMFVACGYQPSSKYSRDVMGEKISTSITISAVDPENTVIIKDAVDSAIIEIFHASLTTKAISDTHLNITVSTPSYAPIQYNEDGYIIGYRMSIVLSITRYNRGVSKRYSAKGSYDFSVEPNAIVTDQERFEAIKFSAFKATSSFIAQVAAEGARAKE